MLSKGLLPLKSVLFLAMSLPGQCMSFLWSWSSIRSASSPVHQNKYLCCFCEMTELMWPQAGNGEGSSDQGCGSRLSPLTAPFQQWLPTSTALWDVVWARWYRGPSCVWGFIDSFETRIIWSWAKNWVDRRSFPPPKNICSVVSGCWCLLWWGQSKVSLPVAVCLGRRGGGAVPWQGCVTRVTRPCPPLCTGETWLSAVAGPGNWS